MPIRVSWRLVAIVLLFQIVRPLPTAGAAGSHDKPAGWEPVGLSGGGAMFTPAISPCDGKLMMLNCDMSAAYLSTDGGVTWRMIPHSQLRSNINCRPAFHPTVRATIFAAGGWSGLKVSRDLGEHWEPIGNLPGDLAGMA